MNFDQSTSSDMVFAVKNGSPSTAVVEAIANAEDCDPADLPPLYGSIDTDALDSLLEGSQGVDISFEHEGYTVNVLGNAEIVLEPKK